MPWPGRSTQVMRKSVARSGNVSVQTPECNRHPCSSTILGSRPALAMCMLTGYSLPHSNSQVDDHALRAEVLFNTAMLVDLLLIVAAYLLGSVSTAIIACRLLRLSDPRSVGSGNPGATNVLRTGGKAAAGITLVGDVLKGLAPVLIAQSLDMGEIAVGAVALAAFCGHVYPIYYGFKGGKGVATALGALLGVHALVAILALGTWLVAAFMFRFASVASLAAGLLAPAYMLWITGSAGLTGITIMMAMLIFWRHRRNIRQLLEGSENRIGSGTAR